MTVRELAQVAPSPRQLAWQSTEFYGFIHFGMNTFTGREWGDGTAAPALFCPEALDAEEWAAALKDAGMRGMILTCKHHDGFCLWPSRYTDYSVASSPWKDGKGDVVAMAVEACAKAGLKFGIYLSPWDRHEPTYGSGDAYNQFYLRQLEELLTGYGPLFSVWFDGACGEGKNGRVQHYDWEAYYSLIRRYQKDACISICGPDVRWCGNEAGVARASEWSVVPASLTLAERTQAVSQQEDDPAFSRRFTSAMEDLGSREAIAGAGPLCWYPAEVDTSIRPGWFYHQEEDGKVRSAETLFSIYCHAVGGNSTLLLNVPPNREGRIAGRDRSVLKELGRRIAALTQYPLHPGGVLTASSAAPGHEADWARDEDLSHYWAPPEGTEQAALELTFPEEKEIGAVILQEAVSQGQRIEGFVLEAQRADGTWFPYAQGTVIGYKKVIRQGVRARALRLVITAARWQPTLASFHVYAPARTEEKE